MLEHRYSDDSRENAIESVLSNQAASSYPTEFAVEIRQQKQLRILLVVNVVLLAFRILAYAPLLRNVSIIVKTLTHALKGVNVVIFIFLFHFVTFTISAHGIFGGTIYRYSTLSHSFVSITTALSGHVDLSGMCQCSRVSFVIYLNTINTTGTEKHNPDIAALFFIVLYTVCVVHIDIVQLLSCGVVVEKIDEDLVSIVRDSRMACHEQPDQTHLVRSVEREAREFNLILKYYEYHLTRELRTEHQRSNTGTASNVVVY